MPRSASSLSPVSRYIPLALMLLGAAWSNQASAQERQGPGIERDTVTIGLGAAMTPSYEGSDNSVLNPGGVLRGKVSGFSFFTRGPQLYADVVRDDDGSGLDIGFGPIVGARFNRTGRIKDARVKALGELDTAIEVGGWAGIAKTGVITSAYDNLSLRVSYVTDVNGAHGSHIVTPAIEYGTPLSQTTYVGVSLSADYVGKGYGRYYYDVTLAGSQASGLGVYGAAGDKAGFAKLNLGLVGAQSLSGDLRKGWALFGLAGYGRILGRYADSPVVRDAGSRNQWLGGLGVAYTF